MSGYIECAECGATFHRDGGTDCKTDTCADWLCEDCAKMAVKIGIRQSTLGGFWGSGERLGDEFSTKRFETRQEAKTDIIRMAEKLYGDGIRIIEE